MKADIPLEHQTGALPSAIEVFLREAFAQDSRVAAPAIKATRFGERGLRIGDILFAMEWQGGLAVKLSPRRVDELVSSGAGTRLKMGRRSMKQWFVVDDPSMWLALAMEASVLAVFPR